MKLTSSLRKARRTPLHNQSGRKRYWAQIQRGLTTTWPPSTQNLWMFLPRSSAT